jgi:hypothetical protein
MKVGYGRLSVIDLGSLINAKPLVTDEKLVRIYEVSGLDAENDKSIIIVQGLKDSGETDLTVDTQTGIKQFHLILEAGDGEDIILNPRLSRNTISSEAFTLDLGRSTVIQMPAHINEYVLAGNPNLVNLKQIKDYYDQDFLKIFAINTNTNKGLTDLVVPTCNGVYKLTLDIGGINNENLQHNSFIDFSDKLSRGF